MIRVALRAVLKSSAFRAMTGVIPIELEVTVRDARQHFDPSFVLSLLNIYLLPEALIGIDMRLIVFFNVRMLSVFNANR